MHIAALARPPSQKGLVRSPEMFEFKKQTYAKKYMPVMEELAKARHHEILEGTYQTNRSAFLIRSTINQITQNILYFNYGRNIYGLECCRLENNQRWSNNQ